MLRVVLPSAATDSDVRTADLPSISLLAERVDVPSPGPIRWEPPSVAEVSAMLPDYEIICLIGRGGMGAVYKARHLSEDRTVAIKLLPPEVSLDEGYRKRFQKEVRVLEHLRHPRIVSLLDAGKAEGVCYYFVMEFVEGTSLHDAIQSRSISPARAKEIMCDICEALAYAHDQGVIHRDLKPGNILLDSSGRAKLADFGTARWRPAGAASHGSTGVLFGTKDYIAPELLLERDTDPRTDIFALGVILYELFCFELPRGLFPLPSEKNRAPKWVDIVVSKALQSNADLRYSSIAEMSRHIESIDPSAPLDPPSISPVVTPRAPRRLARLSLAGALLAVAAVAIYIYRDLQPRPRNKILPRESSDIRSPALPESASPKARTAQATTPALVEPAWQNWTAGNRDLPSGVVGTSAGTIRKSDGGKSMQRLVLTPQLTDQAIRITYSLTAPSGNPLRVYLRAAANLESYYAVSRQGNTWHLLRRKDGDVRAVCGAANISERPLGDEEHLEFSASGNRLRCRHDDHVIFQERNDSFQRGVIVLEFGPEVILSSIEWADLSKSPADIARR